MRGTGIEKEVEICAIIITNKTKCMTPQQKFKTGKGKAIPVQAVESLRVARG
jgi:hypothetical protein